MGLRTTNYTLKKNGMLLPEAYALIHNIRVIGTDNAKVRVMFGIYASREDAKTKGPLENICLEFNANRNESPFVTAYNLAKGMKTVIVKDEVTHQKVEKQVPNVLYGWLDDIV